ncbi:MAG: alpha/beta fold hydrolase [Brevundimonas sp.]|jgi:homoserine O-acetyltransferase|nr:alpha/beta fold hydrolase [Brevundimonas sp.]
MRSLLVVLLALIGSPALAQQGDWRSQSTERTFVLKDFTFAEGGKLDLKLHVTTLGTPRRNAAGEIENAVMVLHGTGGSGHQFFRPQFADELYGPGQPLDIAKYYVILPDNIGHGKSGKPSDGMKMTFPRYNYADMVSAQHRLLTEALGVKKLQLILGTSMGCMHAFVWATTRPGFAERLAPFACNAMEIAGRNRMWRQMTIDAIRADPAWNGGNYTSPPESGLRTARNLSILAGANAWALQNEYPTREKAEAALKAAYAARSAGDTDANDQIYQIDSSRDYNPAPNLAKITVPVLWINSADDFINPPEFGLAQQHAKLMPKAQFVLLPFSPDTKGHGTHTWARFWKKDLAELMARK